MATTFNSVVLIGWIPEPAKPFQTTNGDKVTRFRLATPREGFRKDGSPHTGFDWHRCIAWNGPRQQVGLADIVARHVKVKRQVMVSGRLEYDPAFPGRGEVIVQEFVAIDPT